MASESWNDWAKRMMQQPVPDYPSDDAEVRVHMKRIWWKARGTGTEDKLPVIIGLDLAAPEPGPSDLAVSDAVAAVHDGRRQALRFQQQLD